MSFHDPVTAADDRQEPAQAPLHLQNPALERRVGPLVTAGVLSLVEVHLVDTVAPRFGETDADVLLALVLAARAPRMGHVGVDLRTVAPRLHKEHAGGPTGGAVALDLPADVAAWQAAVERSALVGTPEQTARPFVLQRCRDRRLLMSRRQWREQERVVQALAALGVGAPTPAIAARAAEAFVDRCFTGATRAPEALAAHRDEQANRAVLRAAAARLTVVTGGPGTGKTFSVKRLLALLLSQPRSASDGPLRIELAAPTGKAAVRMAEAMAEGLADLPLDEVGRDRLRTLTPRTLHKLLGMRPDGTSRHGPDNPLDADIVIVDEASMIDLVMMRRLVEAIPPHARLVLLGDRDQLASVEAGTVLSDIVSGRLDGVPAVPSPALADAIVHFTRSYRFQSAPRIARIARDIQEQHATARAVRLLRGDPADAAGLEDPVPDRVVHLGAPAAGRPTREQVDRLAAPYLHLTEGYAGALAAALEAHGPYAAVTQDPEAQLGWLRLLDRHRVLAVHRRGPLGVAGLLHALEALVRGHLEQAVGRSPDTRRLPHQGTHWLGRPVLVLENAYEVGLMNGDIGLVLPRGDRLVAVFPVVHAGQATTRAVPLSRLPPHQGALAMTVHKSQGSQFDRVAMVLAGRPSPIQTRELVYTAITRARRRLDWLGSVAELEAALAQPIERASGLAVLLWP